MVSTPMTIIYKAVPGSVSFTIESENGLQCFLWSSYTL